ncbi:MAG: OB-fold-containig protein [Reyranellaceae bacterium]
MLDFLALPQVAPFSIAALVLIGLTVFEILTLLIGKPISAVLDHAIPLDSTAGDGFGGKDALEGKTGLFGSAFDWLNIGRVPVFVLLIIALAAFSISGLAVQIGFNGVWRPMPTLLAVLVVLVPTAYFTRWSSRLVARIVPRDETYAQTGNDFVGLVGTVTVGPARAGVVARARIVDRHGNAHFPRIEPADPAVVIPAGASVLVIDVRKSVLAVALADPALVADPPAASSGP